MNVETPVAFTVGLLHDIGKLVLSQALTTDLQAEIRSRIEQDKLSTAPRRKKTFSAPTTAKSARCLLQSWHLPEDIVEAVANHHQPVLKPRPRLSVVTHLANCLAHLAGSAPGWDGYAVRVDDKVITTLGVTPDKLEGMVINVRESFDRVDNFIAMA